MMSQINCSCSNEHSKAKKKHEIQVTEVLQGWDCNGFRVFSTILKPSGWSTVLLVARLAFNVNLPV